MSTDPLAPARKRIQSIDLLRGLVMLIMAIDHVRDLMHLGQPQPTDLATTTPYTRPACGSAGIKKVTPNGGSAISEFTASGKSL